MQTASSATQFSMFSYIMEKRRNRRVGREYRVAAEAETGPQPRTTLIHHDLSL